MLPQQSDELAEQNREGHRRGPAAPRNLHKRPERGHREEKRAAVELRQVLKARNNRQNSYRGLIAGDRAGEEGIERQLYEGRSHHNIRKMRRRQDWEIDAQFPHPALYGSSPHLGQRELASEKAGSVYNQNLRQTVGTCAR